MYCILVTGIPAAGKSTMAEVIFKVDTTDFSKIDMEELFSQIEAWKEGI